jgi:hypothetical protein
LVEPTPFHPRKKKKKMQYTHVKILCIWFICSYSHKKQSLYVHSEDIAPSNVIEDNDLGKNKKITT